MPGDVIEGRFVRISKLCSGCVGPQLMPATEADGSMCLTVRRCAVPRGVRARLWRPRRKHTHRRLDDPCIVAGQELVVGNHVHMNQGVITSLALGIGFRYAKIVEC